MSVVTDVLLLLNLDETWVEEDEEELPEEVESEALNAVNAWLREGGYGELADMSGSASLGGNRAMQSLVCAGAFNHLDEEEFFQVVARQKWRSPRNLQLLMKGEFDEKYTLHTLSEPPLPD